ncbi:hypothetical protein [uncultured Acetatifactor sp.]|uniref:hypothetical protein n=1 Tax=uncultured Acetatifactor sp. TaxID=1671927 RepID=UPI002632F17D|nr:hypothetical protein [uncultured Acetatifactor sp.]
MASGYLKAEKHWFDAENEGEQYRLCLTNQEMDRADAPISLWRIGPDFVKVKGLGAYL